MSKYSKSQPKINSNVPCELKEAQDRRLTSKHIDALIRLDDTLLENQKLKSKVDLLEKEYESCSELHKYARSAKKKLESLQSESEQKFEKLQAQHVLELEKKQCQAKEMLAQNESYLKEEISKLKLEVQQLKSVVSELEDDKSSLLCQRQCEEDIEVDHTECFAQIENYKCKLEENKQELHNYKQETSQLVEKSKDNIVQLESKIASLLNELQKEKNLLVYSKDEKQLLNEIELLNVEINSFRLKSEDTSIEYQKVMDKNAEFQKLYEELEKKFRIVKIERDTLFLSLSDLKLENEQLRETHEKLVKKVSVSQINSNAARTDDKNVKLKLRQKSGKR